MSKRVLVVDDDVMNLRMAEFILKKEDYEVCKAESGMECLLFLKDEKPDLILLDIEMPIMNGMSLTPFLPKVEQSIVTASVTSPQISATKT